MDKANWIFLTRPQVADAVAFDFEQYGPQPELFLSFARRIPGVACDRQHRESCSFFEVFLNDRPRLEIAPQNMGFFLLHLLDSFPLSLETLAEIAGAVFQTRVVCGEAEGQEGLWVAHGMGGFICSHCGHCCRDLTYKSDCTKNDVARWRKAGREDILTRVKYRGKGAYEIWADPDSGRILDGCPWLVQDAKTGRHQCQIHDLKPDTCREYPLTPKHAAMTGCRGDFGETLL